MLERLLQWLTRDPRELLQANAEIAWLRAENRRLNDLLTQAWSASRIIPHQAEHVQPPASEAEPFKTWGQQQEEYADECIRNRAAFEAAESERLARLSQPESKPN